MESIGERAFNCCSGLTSITISNSVTSIGSSAFRYCSGLTSITIPNSVTSIGSGAFSDCSSLQKAEFSGIESLCSIMFETPNSNPLCYAKHLYVNGKEITDLVIPDHLTSVGKNAFYNCSGFSSVYIGNNITNIGSNAFSGCSSISSIIIPNNVKTLGDNVFYDCNLKTLIVGTGVTNIGKNQFGNSKAPKTIWLTNTTPNGYLNAEGIVNYVSNDNYSSLRNKKVYKSLSSIFEVDGITYVPVSPSERTCDAIDCNYDKSTEKIHIKDVVAYKNIDMKILNVNPYTFYKNRFIKSINLNNSGAICERAFEDCINITNVTFGDNITNIEDYAFKGCNSLKELTIPDNILSIGNFAFGECTSLQNLNIGDGAKSIGKWAFSGCSSLESFSFGKSMQTIGQRAFSDCTKLTSITSRASKAPKCNSQALDDIDKWSCVLFIPKDCIASYQEADQWKEFFFIQEDETIIPQDVQLALTDQNPELSTGYYASGNVAYTRSTSDKGKYETFFLPFDVDLNNTTGISKVYISSDTALYNPNTSDISLVFQKYDMSSIISAGTPFIALLDGNEVSFTNNVAIRLTGKEEQTIMNKIKVYDYTGEECTFENADIALTYGGIYGVTKVTENGIYTCTASGKFVVNNIGSDLAPFRSFIQLTTSSNSKVNSITIKLDDEEATGINELIAGENSAVDVYGIDGKKLRTKVEKASSLKGLKNGLYIINGKKYIVK